MMPRSGRPPTDNTTAAVTFYGQEHYELFHT